MKHLLLFLLSLPAFWSYAQPSMGVPPAFVSHSDQGTITLLATGFGNKKKAPADAVGSAFNALLFHGIAGAPKPILREPFLQHEKEAWEKFPGFLRGLFYEGGYSKYITRTGPAQKTKVAGFGKKKAYKVELTINYEALLRDLRKEGVIKRPGF